MEKNNIKTSQEKQDGNDSESPIEAPTEFPNELILLIDNQVPELVEVEYSTVCGKYISKDQKFFAAKYVADSVDSGEWLLRLHQEHVDSPPLTSNMFSMFGSLGSNAVSCYYYEKVDVSTRRNLGRRPQVFRETIPAHIAFWKAMRRLRNSAYGAMNQIEAFLEERDMVYSDGEWTLSQIADKEED